MSTAKQVKENWKSPLHLHKHNSRIWLRALDVRGERLGDMTDAEAVREGVSNLAEFRELWERINGDWNEFTYVYRVEFRRIDWDDLLSGHADGAREIGILFKQPMVLAILDGRKDVTRRLKDRYRKGDMLYVRETWRYGQNDEIVFRAVEA